MSVEDISRNIYSPEKHYSSVRMQQGRILLDDDWNEAQRIHGEAQRADNAAIIGGCGSPDQGFKIINPRITGNRIDLDILAGSFYLGGERLDLEAQESLRLQKDWLQLDPQSYPQPVQNRVDLVFLETWQQPVSAVEDSELLEDALGGVDTAVRLRTMRRVRIATDLKTTNCRTAWNRFRLRRISAKRGVLRANELYTNSQLTVSYDQAAVSTSLCRPQAAGGYLGPENQTIRVQLTSRNKLCWGFNNASPLYRVQVLAGRKKIKLLTPPRDEASWPLAGQIVEILPWSALLDNGQKVAETLGFFSPIASSYNPDSGELSLKKALPVGFGSHWSTRIDKTKIQESLIYFYMRIWNRGSDLSSQAEINFTAGVNLTLGNTGLKIALSGKHRLPGDYWILSARPQTPGKVVPWQAEKGFSPRGFRRFMAPLALMQWSVKSGTTPQVKLLKDCRKHFPPLTAITARDVLYDAGNCAMMGSKSLSVQQALDRLCQRRAVCSYVVVPQTGWQQLFKLLKPGQSARICFASGTYTLETPLLLKGLSHVQIVGAGEGTRIVIDKYEEAFRFQQCRSVTLRDLHVESHSIGSEKKKEHINGTLTFRNCAKVTLEQLRVKCGSGPFPGASCVTIWNDPGFVRKSALHGLVSISRSDFGVGYFQTGVLFVNTNNATVNHNRFVANKRPRKLTLEKMLQVKEYRALLRRIMLVKGKVAGVPSKTEMIKVKLSWGSLEAQMYSGKNLAKAWNKVLKLTPPKSTVKTNTHFIKYLDSIADKILISKGKIGTLTDFIHWLAEVKKQSESVASQGIVVAGEEARDLRVHDNALVGMAQGIHIGVSHREVKPGPPDRCGTVQVMGNTVKLVLPAVFPREHFGVFVGNCRSLLIQDNYIQVKRSKYSEDVAIEGIRVFGELGRRAIIRFNHLENFNTTSGIRVKPLNENQYPRPLWMVVENVASVTAPRKVIKFRNYA